MIVGTTYALCPTPNLQTLHDGVSLENCVLFYSDSKGSRIEVDYMI